MSFSWNGSWRRSPALNAQVVPKALSRRSLIVVAGQVPWAPRRDSARIGAYIHAERRYSGALLACPRCRFSGRVVRSWTRSLERRLRPQDPRMPLVAASFALHAGAGSRHDYMSTTKSLRTHRGSRVPTPEFADSGASAESRVALPDQRRTTGSAGPVGIGLAGRGAVLPGAMSTWSGG